MHLGERLSVILKTLVAKRRPRAGQRGMTLLEIMIVLAILALVMGLIVGPRVMAMFADSKVKITKLKVDKYANDAFAQWSMVNSGKSQCPASINDLNQFMNDTGKDAANDAWGHPMKMLCGSSAPPGTTFGIISAGKDGQEGTEDDIKSW